MAWKSGLCCSSLGWKQRHTDSHSQLHTHSASNISTFINSSWVAPARSGLCFFQNAEKFILPLGICTCAGPRFSHKREIDSTGWAVTEESQPTQLCTLHSTHYSGLQHSSVPRMHKKARSMSHSVTCLDWHPAWKRGLLSAEKTYYPTLHLG